MRSRMREERVCGVSGDGKRWKKEIVKMRRVCCVCGESVWWFLREREKKDQKRKREGDFR